MKHTYTQPTGTGNVTVSIDVDYYVPRKGDTICIFGHDVVLDEDMHIGADVTYNEEEKRYEGKPMLTKDGRDLPVFYGNGHSWRNGEGYTRPTLEESCDNLLDWCKS